jgi:hypothetical protein
MIKNWETFLEARLKDLVNLKGFDAKTKSRWGFDKEFDLEGKLVKIITTNKRVGGKKLQFKITYFNDIHHSITDRIQKRTNLNDVEEFNFILKNTLNRLVEEKENFIFDRKYAVYLKEYNFVIIFTLDYELKELNIYTILPGSGVNNVRKVFVY